MIFWSVCPQDTRLRTHRRAYTAA